MGSASSTSVPFTKTCPEVALNIPLISRNNVVLPLPLRPSSTSVSPFRISSDIFERMGTPDLGAMRYSTPRKAMVTFSRSVAFAFISIDTPPTEGDHPNVVQTPGVFFSTYPSRGSRIQRRGQVMGAPAAARIRHDLQTLLVRARARTDEIFSLIREEALYDRPIAERHRLIFYLGHVEAFDWNLLGRRAFGLRSFNPTFDQLFAFGIDPIGGGLPTDGPLDWPTRRDVERYNARVRDELDSAIEAALDHPSEGHPQLFEMLETAIEHRLMHAETLAYLL